jgi:hypothetical protein
VDVRWSKALPPPPPTPHPYIENRFYHRPFPCPILNMMTTKLILMAHFINSSRQDTNIAASETSEAKQYCQNASTILHEIWYECTRNCLNGVLHKSHRHCQHCTLSNSCSNNLNITWIPETLFVKVDRFFMPPEDISKAYFIDPSLRWHQHCSLETVFLPQSANLLQFPSIYLSIYLKHIRENLQWQNHSAW